jgi:hypothetical protein
MKGLDKGGQGPTSGCCAIEEEEEEEEMLGGQTFHFFNKTHDIQAEYVSLCNSN